MDLVDFDAHTQRIERWFFGLLRICRSMSNCKNKWFLKIRRFFDITRESGERGVWPSVRKNTTLDNHPAAWYHVMESNQKDILPRMGWSLLKERYTREYLWALKKKMTKSGFWPSQKILLPSVSGRRGCAFKVRRPSLRTADFEHVILKDGFDPIDLCHVHVVAIPASYQKIYQQRLMHDAFGSSTCMYQIFVYHLQ